MSKGFDGMFWNGSEGKKTDQLPKRVRFMVQLPQYYR